MGLKIPKTLFPSDLPTITTQEELTLLLKRFSRWDPHYTSSGAISDRRELFEELYARFRIYANEHFISEITKRFHQRSWEMYVGCTLLDMDMRFTVPGEGPDFLISGSRGERTWIECVACEVGSGPDKVPPIVYGRAQSVPSDEILIRLANSLSGKFSKYQKYLRDGIVRPDDRFVVAINAGEVGFTDGPYPYIVRCTLAVGYPTLSWPKGQGGVGPGKPGASSIPFITKKNGSKVSMMFLLDEEHSGISGVLYSKKTVLNHSEDPRDDLILVQNHLAKNPLAEKMFLGIKTYKVDASGQLEL